MRVVAERNASLPICHELSIIRGADASNECGSYLLLSSARGRQFVNKAAHVRSESWMPLRTKNIGRRAPTARQIIACFVELSLSRLYAKTTLQEL